MPETTLVFSVIVPTHNRPSQLAECLRALADQNFPRDRFEVIVVDDGSTAPLGSIVDSFRHQLALTSLRQDQAGPAAARNTGAQHARGRYLAFTDDDCAPAGDWLSNLENRLTRTPNLLCGGRSVNGLGDNRYSAASQAVIDTVYGWQPEARNFPQFFATNNFGLPAELFRQVGGFNASFITSEDREFCDRWTHHGYAMAYAPEAVVLHRHDLNLRSLLRQHFNYGRGAMHFHRLRAQRGWGRFQPDGSFYVSLFRHGMKQSFAKAVPAVALLACTQLAVGTGYLWEKIAGPRSSRASQRPALRTD